MKNSYDILPLLACFDWFSLKTIERDDKRGYEVQIRHRQPGAKYRTVYTATAAMPIDAARRCIAKVQDRDKGQPAPKPGPVPILRLVT
ncbi:MAG: hypothetical protein IT443_12065 [Phycisphaeraceae bacterium]|nr:hypothetical protein [Phycisphaeraceae bacterium]